MPLDSNSDCNSVRPYRLKNVVQHYSWGKRNEAAYIADLLERDPEPDVPFAELWMGTHPNAPSHIIDPELGELSLSDWISQNPSERLSSNRQSSVLPYLFKVLSAGDALSIQSHPSKKQAEKLHQLDPQHYPDNNHKPEIAIALDSLDALVGFISNELLADLFSSIPELRIFQKKNQADPPDLKDTITQLFYDLEQNAPLISRTNKEIHMRLSGKESPTESERLFLDLYSQRGASDPGLLFVFFLNRVHLLEGEAVFLAPGVPHAYLNGNIIECMANSDNVVRLGLTEKFCDVKALSQILVYDGNTDYKIVPEVIGSISTYQTPAEEFLVKMLKLHHGEAEAFTSRTALAMFLIIEGEISLHWRDKENSCTCVFRRGHSFVTPANLRSFSIKARQDTKLFFVEIPQKTA